MKAQELRIGNWVLDEFNLLVEFDIDCFVNYTQGKFKPIPLTEEWLIRLGFEEHSLNPYWFNKGIICISIVHKVELISWDRQIFKLDIEINHVHQLQNLYFALTNTELCTSK